MFRVGNDIMDLANPRNRGKIKDLRFISRILSPDEQEYLFASINQNAILWALWTGKETAYKVIRKLKAPVAFSPRLYRVSLYHAGEREGKSNSSPLDDFLSGEVDTKYGTVYIIVMITRSFVHCIGTNDLSAINSIIWKAEPISPETASPVADESSFVRKIAVCHLSTYLNMRPEDIDIRRFKGSFALGPPIVYLQGKPTKIELSLSHDGRYAAYAFNKSASLTHQ